MLDQVPRDHVVEVTPQIPGRTQTRVTSTDTRCRDTRSPARLVWRPRTQVVEQPCVEPSLDRGPVTTSSDHEEHPTTHQTRSSPRRASRTTRHVFVPRTVIHARSLPCDDTILFIESHMTDDVDFHMVGSHLDGHLRHMITLRDRDRFGYLGHE